MKKLIFCLAILAFFVSCEPAVSSSNFSQIRGVVSDSDTGDWISGATVILDGPAGADTKETDSYGKFIFYDVDPGRYDIRVSKAGYVNAIEHVTIVAEDDKEIAIKLKQNQ